MAARRRRLPLAWHLLVACACLLAAAPVMAQAPAPRPGNRTIEPSSFSIRGSLHLSSNNEAAEMIRVELKKYTGEVVAVSFTGSNGEFEFGGLSSGEYLVVVEEKGFLPVRERVEVRYVARTNIFLYLREPADPPGEAPAGPTVSARELALPPKAADALRKGREALFVKHKPEESLKHFRALAKGAPDFYEAGYYSGLAYSEMGKADAAESEWRKAIADSGETHGPSYVSLASLLCNQKRFAEAEPMARKGGELSPEDWQAHFELARALLGTDRADEALAAAHVAQEKRADFPDLHLLVANIQIRRNDAQGLLAALDGYLQRWPEGPMSDKVRAAREQLLEDMRAARSGQAQPRQQPPPQ